jgi:hypothetical protein
MSILIKDVGTMSHPASAIIFCGGEIRTKYTIVNGKVVNGTLVDVHEKPGVIFAPS